MKIITGISYLLMVLAFSGCTSDSSESDFLARRTTRGASALLKSSVTAAGVPVSPLEGKTWGEITGEPLETFQLAVRNLMSSTLLPQEVGFVSGQSGDITGVRFWGQAELASGPLDSANIAATTINLNTATLRIVVWDSFAGTEDQNGNTIPEYPISFNKAVSGTVSGNTATLVFEDAYGRITLAGNFDQNLFQGQVSFQNKTSFNRALAPQEGILGNFTVNTCGFFRCQ